MHKLIKRGMTWQRSPVFAAFAALLATAMPLACGDTSSSPVVIRVGGESIDRAAVEHWTGAIRLGSGVGASLGRAEGAPRERALDFLIAAHWLLGQAAKGGLRVSDGSVRRALRERVEAVPDGEAEFKRELASTGQTVADVELELRAALAAKAIGESLLGRIAPVTHAEVASYYARNRRQFRVPDRRLVDLIEDIESPRAAIALGRRLGTGRRFAKRGIREIVAREASPAAARNDNHQLVHAIFAATPGRLGGPAPFHHEWVLLVVRKLIPSAVTPLAQVSEKIEQQLVAERRRRALAGYLAAYRRTWTSRTTCRAGYVVQRCSEYRGRIHPEGNPFAA